MLELLIPYYSLVFVIVGFLGTITITADGTVCNIDNVLSKKQDFVRCVFMYQVAIYELLNDEINIFGIAILELLMTLSAWFLNVIIFLVLIFCIFVKMIWFLFCLLFAKRDDK